MNRYDVRRAGHDDRSVGVRQTPAQERRNDRMSKAAELWACRFYERLAGVDPNPPRHHSPSTWGGSTMSWLRLDADMPWNDRGPLTQ